MASIQNLIAFFICLLTSFLVVSATKAQKRFLAENISHSVCRDMKADILFLLDMSTSMGHANFQLEKEFVSKFTEQIPVGHDHFQIGVETYSSNLYDTLEFKLSSNKTVLQQKINNLKYHAGSRTIFPAWRKAIQLFSSVTSGERRYVSKIIFLVISGPSSSSSTDVAMVNALRHIHNTSTFVLAVTNDANTNHISSLASNEKHLVFVNDFNELATLSDSLFSTLCKDVVSGYHCVDLSKRACKLWPCTGIFKEYHCPRKCGTCTDFTTASVRTSVPTTTRKEWVTVPDFR